MKTTLAAPTDGDNDDREKAVDGGQSSQAPIPIVSPCGFNLADYRLPQGYADHAGGEKLLTSIPVRKPNNAEWFKTNPDENMRVPAAVIEMKDRNETYLVQQHLWPDLSGDATFVQKLLIPTITRQGTLLLWPIRLPGPSGTLDDWNQSAMEAAAHARESWVRMCSNRSLGAYEIIKAADQREAVWPKIGLEEIMRIAFRNRLITTLDHPIVRQLRGVA